LHANPERGERVSLSTGEAAWLAVSVALIVAAIVLWLRGK
jgi:hypothetical protein